MLRIRAKPLDPAAAAVLRNTQRRINSAVDYPARVVRANAEWNAKGSGKAKAAALRSVRATLASMCVGIVRCAYCEDSRADEVEHIYPKNIFPERAFVWQNYTFACGPCNGPKGNRYGVVQGHSIAQFSRRKNDPVVPPPSGRPGFFDPRTEDPMLYLEIDLGGTTPDGETVEGTFEYMVRSGLSAVDAARAEFSIEIFGLNRELVREARANAFTGFRARLLEYAQKRANGASSTDLAKLKLELLRTPHLSVFHEMRRQRAVLPEIDAYLSQAPEAARWPLT